ncbi:hypothetical protein V1514DRAFT_354071 [Lipomyces japonicus]|uniref:uncharacterized protein n=1 Tax=Lipomyces japonicus TaxID=56871 RepID=UPI0034CFF881
MVSGGIEPPILALLARCLNQLGQETLNHICPNVTRMDVYSEESDAMDLNATFVWRRYAILPLTIGSWSGRVVCYIVPSLSHDIILNCI